MKLANENKGLLIDLTDGDIELPKQRDWIGSVHRSGKPSQEQTTNQYVKTNMSYMRQLLEPSRHSC
jgi:hypothetical protein